MLRSAAVGAELLRRGADGTWPERPVTLEDGVLELQSIGFRVELAAVYRTTRLARG